VVHAFFPIPARPGALLSTATLCGFFLLTLTLPAEAAGLLPGGGVSIMGLRLDFMPKNRGSAPPYAAICRINDPRQCSQDSNSRISVSPPRMTQAFPAANA
jgi:hypothetical protein